jgi:hypothetical protein
MPNCVKAGYPLQEPADPNVGSWHEAADFGDEAIPSAVGVLQTPQHAPRSWQKEPKQPPPADRRQASLPVAIRPL